MKNSFIFYADYMRHLELLTMEQRGVLITALSCYQLGEDLPEMDGVTKMAFSFIAQDIDKNNEKYDRVCKARSEAGKKGGAPKGNKNAEKQAKTSKNKQKQAKQTKQADNDNEKDNDNENDNDIYNISIADKSATEPPQKSYEDAYKVMDLYNDICTSLPRCMHYTDKRVKAINTRLKKYTIADFEKVFAMAQDSDFISGRSDKWKGANIDWLINEANMVKVLEGNYADKKAPKNKFINFNQRNYTDIEKQFLGVT